ncbi:MAG: hypothetical protein M3019_02085 [Candidatus Dormibacteraeota bacterium]|nr:hypothetical protein [Candidatus Dormibacteraeota bacterium]
MLNHPDATLPYRYGEPNIQLRNNRLATMRRHYATMRTRQKIAVIDEVIEVLEERNLEGERRIDRGVRKLVRRLEAEVDVPLPRQVLRARNTARLHGAVLDWMETVVDQLIPERRRFPDLEPE